MLHGEFLWNKADRSILCLLNPDNGASELTGTVYLENTIMLKKLLFAGMLFAAADAQAQDSQKLSSKIQKVTIFLNGAQVTRTANASISPGTSTLVFENISPYVDEQSIQLHANGNFTILSVKAEKNYLNDQDKQKGLIDLQAHQKAILGKIDIENNLLAVNQEEENMLLKNQVVTGENASLDVIKLKQALDFQTERLTAIRKKKLEINSVLSSLDSARTKYQLQIGELMAGNRTNTDNILVTVSSKEQVQSDFTINYVTTGVNWYPTYDIRAKDAKSPISIAYKANVTQQTGEDWRNVKLTLSTGNPMVNGNKPELNPYYLNFAVREAADANAVYKNSSPPALNEVVVVGYGAVRKTALTGSVSGLSSGYYNVPAQYSNVSQSETQTNVEFTIADPYTIPSDGKQYTVEINQAELNATYTYAVAPKLSTDVFLSASITDWNKYSFLPGQANLFFEGTYIGKSYLNANSTNDTLKLSLGVDKGIVVTRTLQKELTQRQSIGSNQKDTRDWSIEIKNRKNQPVNLVVEDQVPVAQNSSIEVETQNVSGGTVDAITGKISWTMALKPLENKKLELKYQVKYPKNQLLAIE